MRCAWAEGPADLTAYHDHEWGRAVHGDQALYERLTLEGFQSGLSWLTILRKREHFRSAFAGFDIVAVANYTQGDRERLMADPGIVRNRRKIDAAIANAQALRAWRDAEGEGMLDALVWSFAEPTRTRPSCMADVPAQSAASTALSRALKARGLVFVGPVTAYSTMQACGVVDDHVIGCEAAAG